MEPEPELGQSDGSGSSQIRNTPALKQYATFSFKIDISSSCKGREALIKGKLLSDFWRVLLSLEIRILHSVDAPLPADRGQQSCDTATFLSFTYLYICNHIYRLSYMYEYTYTVLFCEYVYTAGFKYLIYSLKSL